MTHRTLSSYRIYPDGKRKECEREYICECPIDVYFNYNKLYSTVCTAVHMKEMIMGRLYTDGIINSTDNVTISVDEDMNTAHVTEDKTESICAALVKPETYTQDDTTHELIVQDDIIKEAFRLSEVFRAHEGLHGITGAAHKCILSYKGNDYVFEDISRHNTVDKAVGHALLNNIPLSDCIMFSSGRVPVDMAKKVIAAGIPVLVSKSVPTAESVNLAKKAGLILIIRAWPDSCEVF